MIADVRWLVELNPLPISSAFSLLAVWFDFLFLRSIQCLSILTPIERCYPGGDDLEESIFLGVVTGAGAMEWPQVHLSQFHLPRRTGFGTDSLVGSSPL